MNIIEKYKFIETINENPNYFLEMLSSTEEEDYNIRQVIRLFEKWESERNLEKNIDKKEDINCAYFQLINYIKNNSKEIKNFKSRTHYLIKLFLKLEYNSFKGLINLLEDTKETNSFEDVVIYWAPHRTEDEIKYAILAGGFYEPEVYEKLKQKSLKLTHKNTQNN